MLASSDEREKMITKTETEFIEEIDRLNSAEKWTEALRVAEAAILAYPGSADLQCAFGDLIQLSDDETYKAADALSAYQRAAELDPTFAEAYEEIGYYWDVCGDDFERAEAAFRRAIELGAGADSYAGLARVLAERGKDSPAILSFLDQCPYAAAPEVRKIRAEIENGIWAPFHQY